MYSLSRPIVSASEAYALAVSAIKKKDARVPYYNAKNLVAAKCDAFDLLAERNDLHLAVGSEYDIAGLDGAKMVELYDKQFTSRATTADLKDGIKNAAPNSLCPYCGQGYVFELDHYLPKTSFAGTSVHPANLVPCCSDCNFAKRAYIPGEADPAVLHPYFDVDAFNVQWLVATLERGALETARVTFGVQLPQPDDLLAARLHRHLKVFKLQERFRAWAAQALNNFEILLTTNEGMSMTLEQAEQHLRRNAISLSGGRVNSWERATYTAMAQSDWYLRDKLGLPDTNG
ncbi:HNH endonuclease [Microbacterium sp. 20-116]|uniref:HNH endonuclease n=1 Tax=Microbacterium sp. 20-116 TaxID=3239883 RepID=UPI0034E195DC